MDAFLEQIVPSLQGIEGLPIPVTIVVSLVVIIIVAKSISAIGDMVDSFSLIVEYKWFVLLAIVLVMLAAFAGVKYSSYQDRSAPKILNSSGLVFNNALLLKWLFDERGLEGKAVSYNVIINNERGENLLTKTQSRKQISIGLYGDLSIKIVAEVDGAPYSESAVHHIQHYRSTLHKIGLTKKMLVGVYDDPHQGLFSYKDDQGESKGFDIDLLLILKSALVRELVDELAGDDDVEITFKYREWQKLMPEVGNRELDLAISSFTIREDREEEYGIVFSAPYINTTLCVIGLPESVEKHKQGRYSELVYGVGKKTTAQFFYDDFLMKDQGLTEKERRLYKHNADLFAALVNREADLAVYDYIRSGIVMKKHPEWDRFRIEPGLAGIDEERYGIAIHKNDIYLKARIDAAMKTEEKKINALKVAYGFIPEVARQQ